MRKTCNQIYLRRSATDRLSALNSFLQMDFHSSPSTTRHRRRHCFMSCRRAILILSAFLISMFAKPSLIDARTSSWHGQQHQQNSNFAFVCLPQSMPSMNSDDKSIHLQNAFKKTIHPTKSAHVLEFFRSRKRAYDHDAAASDNSQYQPSPISREYKTDDEEDVPLQLPEQSEIGIVLYNANQTANHEVNELSTLAVAAAAAGNATRISKRSMLASSLRSLRPLIVPPWMLPFILNERDESVCTLDEKESSMVLSSSSQPEEVAIAVPNITSNNVLNVSDQLPFQISNVIEAEIESHTGTLESDETQMIPNEEQIERTSKRRFFRRQHDRNIKRNKAVVTKEEATCPVIVSNIHELRNAVLVNKIPLRDVGFRFPVNGIGSEILSPSDEPGVSLYIDDVPNEKEKQETAPEAETIFQRHDPVLNGTLSSLLTCGSDASFNRNSTYYQQGIDLLSNHPVLSLVEERVKTNSTPGNRMPTDDAHLALCIEGGGMRGAVSAGMAAALSTLDLLDTFDSVHGSSAGAIIGAYVVSRQLCTDVYTDIMPAAGNKFASKKRTLINVGVDWLSDLVTSYDESNEKEIESNSPMDSDAVCELVDGVPNNEIDAGNASMWICEDEITLSSVELAMGKDAAGSQRRSRWTDDHYDGLLFESMQYLLSRTRSAAQRTISKPISFGMRYANQAFDLATSMGQYLKRKPGMNLTYVLDGIMDETHGLRPFDIEAFKANDKKQPLYIVASAVSNGGSGEMETIAFNSKEGDFFGLSPDHVKESQGKQDTQRSWYRRAWNLVKRTSSALYSAAYSVLFIVEPKYGDTVLPPGTKAISGLVNKRKGAATPKQQDDSFYEPTGRINGEGKNGLFPCLEASMLVPGIGNAPIQLIRSKRRKFIESTKFPRFLPRRQQALDNLKKENSHLCYDAFCYEPIPYRSAVEKAGATHVLALRSRPDGCVVETKQHLYERVVGPIYFRKHGMNNVAKLFSSGGSQFRYIEDVLTLNEGLAEGVSIARNDKSAHPKGVKVPPTTLLFGTDNLDEVSIDTWRRAHLLPISLPFGTPELPTLSQDREEVLKAVRHGYAAAFDVLAPIAGLPFDCKSIPGEKVAEILFPGGDDDIADVLNKPVKIKSSYIGTDSSEVIKELRKRERFAAWVTGKREAKKKAQEEVISHPQGALARMIERRSSSYHESDQYVRDPSNTLEWLETEALLAALPGFRNGKLDHIVETLLAKEERKQDG